MFTNTELKAVDERARCVTTRPLKLAALKVKRSCPAAGPASTDSPAFLQQGCHQGLPGVGLMTASISAAHRYARESFVGQQGLADMDWHAGQGW